MNRLDNIASLLTDKIPPVEARGRRVVSARHAQNLRIGFGPGSGVWVGTDAQAPMGKGDAFHSVPRSERETVFTRQGFSQRQGQQRLNG